MNEELLFWGLALLAVALLLLVVEVFIPSGGLISIGASVAAIVGIVFLFRYNTTWGLMGVLSVVILGPAAFSFALKVWPSTPLGRKMLGEPTAEQREAQVAAAQRERDRTSALLGAEGLVIADLRPIGVVNIDGERIDALSESGFVRAGSRVRVTAVEFNQVRVRPLA